MPRTVLEFGEWMPDQGPINNPGLWFARNVVKISDNYENTPSLRAETTGSGTTLNDPLALHYHIKRDGKDPLFFWATSSTIHVAEEDDTTWYDASGGAYTATDWSFCSFGPTVIATNGVDAMQGYAVDDTFDSADNFAALLVTTSPTTANIKPKYVCVYKNHVFAANITMAADWPASSPQFTNGTLYPELVWWSDTDNATRFGDLSNSPTLKNSGWQLLYDGHGEIKGMAVAGDAMYVFKQRSIYRCDGSPFTFSPISIGTGCAQSKSICVLDGEVYFWSSLGPCKINLSGEVVRLGQDTCYRSLSEGSYYTFPSAVSASSTFSINMDATTRTVWSVADPNNKLIAFYYNSDDTDETTPATGYANSLLLYNAKTDKFYYMNNAKDESDFYVNRNVKHPVAVLTTTGGILSNVVVVVDGGAGSDFLATYQVESGSFSSGSGEGYAYFRLPFVRLGNGASRITKVRPILNFIPGSTSTFKVHVGIITRQAINAPSGGDTDQITIDTTSLGSASGWIDTSSCVVGLSHSIGISFAPTSSALAKTAVFKDISGIEVEYAELGVRGA